MSILGKGLYSLIKAHVWCSTQFFFYYWNILDTKDHKICKFVAEHADLINLFIVIWLRL